MKKELLAYSMANQEKLFVSKNVNHREVEVMPEVTEAALYSLDGGRTFVQEFVRDPFLVDGRKFDIGVYIVVTSIDPLRIYKIDGRTSENC